VERGRARLVTSGSDKVAEYDKWRRARKRVHDALLALQYIEPKLGWLDWEGTTEQEVEDTLDEILEADAWLHQVTDVLIVHLGDRAIRTKIEKLRETSGRTKAEQENALRLIKRLETKLSRLEAGHA
jgi:hypothetical protein